MGHPLWVNWLIFSKYLQNLLYAISISTSTTLVQSHREYLVQFVNGITIQPKKHKPYMIVCRCIPHLPPIVNAIHSINLLSLPNIHASSIVIPRLVLLPMYHFISLFNTLYAIFVFIMLNGFWFLFFKSLFHKLLNHYLACLYSFECISHGDSKNSNEIQIMLKNLENVYNFASTPHGKC